MSEVVRLDHTKARSKTACPKNFVRSNISRINLPRNSFTDMVIVEQQCIVIVCPRRHVGYSSWWWHLHCQKTSELYCRLEHQGGRRCSTCSISPGESNKEERYCWIYAGTYAGTCFAITYLISPRGPEGALLDLEGFPSLSTLLPTSGQGHRKYGPDWANMGQLRI